MVLKLYSIPKLRIGFAVIIVFMFWLTLRSYFNNKPPALSRIELSADGSATVMTLLPVLVEIYYEALCPDSRSFLLTQLLPTYEKIPSAMNVQLIPYGRAKTTPLENSYKFECQHGPVECLANKVHACGLNLIKTSSVRIHYTTCMINDNMNPEEVGSHCAKKLGVDWEPIWECAQGIQGSKLLYLYGKKTDKLGYIDFIPTIALQGSTEKQPAILKNLLKEICALYKEELPRGCPKAFGD